MKQLLEWSGVVALVILAIIVLVPSKEKPLGGYTNSDAINTSALKVGASGALVGNIIPTTCNLLGMDVSQAASSTASYDCAVTGVVSGDYVFASLATSTQNTSVLNWVLAGVRASSTAGYVTMRVSNFSGAAATPSVTAVGSSTVVLVIHPLTAVPGL